MTEQIPYEIECPICGSKLKQIKTAFGYAFFCLSYQNEEAKEYGIQPNKKAKEKHPNFNIVIACASYDT